MYTIQPTPLFERNKKRLKKKYPSVEDDYQSLLVELKKGNFIGDELQGFKRLKGKVVKVRVPSSDQQRGKSGGFRIIYYFISSDKIVYFLYIFAKTKQENIVSNQVERIQNLIDFLNDF